MEVNLWRKWLVTEANTLYHKLWETVIPAESQIIFLDVIKASVFKQLAFILFRYLENHLSGRELIFSEDRFS